MVWIFIIYHNGKCWNSLKRNILFNSRILGDRCSRYNEVPLNTDKTKATPKFNSRLHFKLHSNTLFHRKHSVSSFAWLHKALVDLSYSRLVRPTDRLLGPPKAQLI